uniref:Uncharacterized protein n=1 Tax=viral metagenome TaxID=1070528 RepID=A0A6M3KI93_9ZZZZ
MTLLITNWNVEENRDWFVQLSDSGSAILAELFYTKSDAQHGNNRVAYGSGSYGTDQEVILTAESGYSINLFQSEYLWYLKVSGTAGNPTKVYRLKAFTDLDPILHSIFRNTDLITLKATEEINAHTYAKILRDTPLGTHIPDIAVGDVLTINSSRRGVNEQNQILSHIIQGVISKGDVRLTSNLKIVKYLEITK